MLSLEIHQKTVEALRNSLVDHKKQQKALTLSRVKGHSNTTRSGRYKENTGRLPIENFKSVLSIDPEKKTAWVQPGITMEELARKTLDHGLIPKVLPEFKGITAGGAVMGAALESSSHAHGQFNDICSFYEIMLGDGTLLEATPEKNSDLFYGISGSYGTLGLLTSIEIQLQPAGQWIALTYRRFHHIGILLNYLRNLCSAENPPDFIEGLLLSPQEGLVIEGRRLPTEETQHLNSITTMRRWDDWFVKQASRKRDGEQERIPYFDYLFRYDRGAFWMGYFAIRPQFLWRHLLYKQQWLVEKVKRAKTPFSSKSLNGSFLPKMLGPLMDSQRLYASLHAVPENWFAKSFVVQDFYIPEAHAEAFIQHAFAETAITPLWLCPVRGSHKPQFFSPHYCSLPQTGTPPLFINVGVYGIPKPLRSAPEATKNLEQMANSLEGRKMLYGQSYYTKEEFWKIYSLDQYERLRNKYHATGTWLPLDEKVLTVN